MSAAAFDVCDFDDSEESYANLFEMWEMTDEKVRQSAENSYINDLNEESGLHLLQESKTRPAYEKNGELGLFR